MRSIHARAAEPLLDFLALIAAVAAVYVSASFAGPPAASLWWNLLAVAFTLLSLAASGQYRQRFTLQFLDDARTILGATASAAMAVAFLRLLFAPDADIAGQAARFWLLASVYTVAARGAFQLILSRARSVAGAGEPTLIIGAGSVGHFVARRLLDRPEFGLRPVAFVDDDPLEVDEPARLPVLRTEGKALADRIADLIDELGARHVVIAFSLGPHEEKLDLIRRCRELGASVSLVPRMFEAVPDETTLERLGGVPLVTVHPRDPRGWQFALKYAFDRVVAAIAIVLVSPVLIFAALGVLLTMGRPILFRQERVGLDGKSFDMLKFRTMRGSPDKGGEADAAWAQAVVGERGGEADAAAVKAAAEDRRTPFGSLLRRTGIDELPQLFNVLRGEMSLVGPRPERRAYVELFERTIRRYDDRHRVKAGITGWAQVNGLRGETSLEDRVEWDNYYIENWSWWLDMKIILLTARALFRGSGS
ncbi:MAG TPA: sugar transferase [Solirubrobacterales bacterium]